MDGRRARSVFDPGRLEGIADFLRRRYLEPGRLVGCDLVIARADEVVYRCTLGRRDRERDLAVGPDTIWRLYSMTKPVTSIALMQLYERGEVLLEDPVHRYIPEWRGLRVAEPRPDGSLDLVEPRRPMTVLDALTHMTGLPGAIGVDHPSDAAFAERLSVAKSGMTLEKV
jgi:CubicO group peptidase (beta-lactamase class C family)